MTTMTSISILNAVFNAKRITSNFMNGIEIKHPDLKESEKRKLTACEIKRVRKEGYNLKVANRVRKNVVIAYTFNGFYLLKNGVATSPAEAIESTIDRKFVMLQAQNLYKGKDIRVPFKSDKLFNYNSSMIETDFFKWLEKNKDTLSSVFIEDTLMYLESIGFNLLNHKTDLKLFKLVHSHYWYLVLNNLK